jgi:sialate O-acetylesterase
MEAGGPYTLKAQGASGASQTASDIEIGDVWLCGGQSNMELSVRHTLNAEDEIAQAGNSRIRLLTIPHATSPSPLAAFPRPIAWRPAGPESVRDFSAACFYFARELQKTVNVPMGLIAATWNGSNIEAWISANTLRELPGFTDRLNLLSLYDHDPNAGNRRLGLVFETWWHGHEESAPWSAEPADQNWRPTPEPLRDWKTWSVPELANHNGMVWYRRSVMLTRAQAAESATLSLGGIDEVDITWVNGRVVGSSFGWGDARSYRLPRGVLHAGENTIAVNVLSTWDAGGMMGPANQMSIGLADGSSLPLGGGWLYRNAAERYGDPPRAPWHSVGGLSTLYNAMIAPLEDYALRGVVWYQGESNTSSSDQYQGLLTALLSDWRARFGASTPFLIVQLPNFGQAPQAPTASGWASVREAERRVVAADPHAALAVSIDIGIDSELHPPNKQEVGRRLARAARHIVYGEALSPSGPEASSARRDNGRIIVSFANVEGALGSISGAPLGFELCAAAQNSCRFVSAALEANEVVIGDDGAPATRVRYCWGDGPLCNLHDRSGLPAGPFELSIR